MTQSRRTTVVVLGLATGLGAIAPAARAALIASESFLTTATPQAGYYVQGNINGQASTNGTTGYFAGPNSGNQVVGWQSGSGVVQATPTTALTHPYTVNAPAATPDGSLFAAGNANPRLQYRDLANASAPASSSYFFSLLTRESVNSYAGTVYAGLGPSRPLGDNGVVPTTGVDVGYVNGALTLFYNNGGAALATQTLVAAPAVNSTYQVTLGINATSGAITPSVYDQAGTLVNNPAAQTVTATIAPADLGAFQAFATSQFNGGSPSQVFFDEFRFGTALGDVTTAVPEPAAAGLLALGGTAMLGRRRRPGRARA